MRRSHASRQRRSDWAVMLIAMLAVILLVVLLYPGGNSAG